MNVPSRFQRNTEALNAPLTNNTPVVRHRTPADGERPNSAIDPKRPFAFYVVSKLHQKTLVLGELLRVFRFAPRSEIAGRRTDNSTTAAQRPNLESAVGELAVSQCEVDTVPYQVDVMVGELELDRNVRMSLKKLGHNPAHVLTPDILRRRETNVTDELCLAPLNASDHLVRIGENSARTLGERPPVVGQRDGARRPRQQARTQVAFERCQSVAHCRRGQPQLPPGRRQTPFIDNQQEQTQVVERHYPVVPKSESGRQDIAPFHRTIHAQVMKAIGFFKSHPIDHPESLLELESERPKPGDHDLLVEVRAASINPVDSKVRQRAATDAALPSRRVLGYDAVGIVRAIGSAVVDIGIGDRVWYAGAIDRDGSNAEYQLVDARIAARAPHHLSDPEAAALPLTALTAWEALFDRLRIDPNETDKSILIVGGAGGVGSITTQIAKAVTSLKVIATASRPETTDWVRKMGADHVANHRDLVHSVRGLGFETVDYIFNTADTYGHWDAMCELIAPQGLICGIVESTAAVDLTKLQSKSAGFVWELMFTRPLFKTTDLSRQHDILRRLAGLVDGGQIQTTLTDTLQGLSVDTFKEAHRRIESGKTIGKVTISY